MFERYSLLKHFQVLSGMTNLSYWATRFINDAIKLYLIIGVSMIFMVAYGFEFESAFVVLVLIPLGVLPLTYVVSFCFDNVTVAFITLFFVHFVSMLVVSTIVFILRVANDFMEIGDDINSFMRFNPTYSIA